MEMRIGCHRQLRHIDEVFNKGFDSDREDLCLQTEEVERFAERTISGSYRLLAIT